MRNKKNVKRKKEKIGHDDAGGGLLRKFGRLAAPPAKALIEDCGGREGCGEEIEFAGAHQRRDGSKNKKKNRETKIALGGQSEGSWGCGGTHDGNSRVTPGGKSRWRSTRKRHCSLPYCLEIGRGQKVIRGARYFASQAGNWKGIEVCDFDDFCVRVFRQFVDAQQKGLKKNFAIRHGVTSRAECLELRSDSGFLRRKRSKMFSQFHNRILANLYCREMPHF